MDNFSQAPLTAAANSWRTPPSRPRASARSRAWARRPGQPDWSHRQLVPE